MILIMFKEGRYVHELRLEELVGQLQVACPREDTYICTDYTEPHIYVWPL